ncbi:MAG: DUF255 domain-containing protein [Planctomycetes bacterium]|nr:DUF255 domain-containing protein [Planctomycetota bacterium]
MVDRNTTGSCLRRAPNLLQHVANPVDWCNWGDEAFKKAQEDDNRAAR